MKRFIKQKSGSTVIGVAFLILIFFTLAFVVYTGEMVYAKYQNCETELERLATVTVDSSTVNANVRDLTLNLPDSARSLLEENLTGAGWMQENGDWVKYDGSKWIYSLEDMQITVEDTALQIDATFAMPLPWIIGGQTKVTMPIMVRSRILFLE